MLSIGINMTGENRAGQIDLMDFDRPQNFNVGINANE